MVEQLEYIRGGMGVVGDCVGEVDRVQILGSLEMYILVFNLK